MLIIAHRGLLDGPDENLQNRPEQIDKALDARYDVEIDVWYVEGKWYLGHDTPEHEVNWDYLSRPGMWLHCKNIDAFYKFKSHWQDAPRNYFYHNSDLIVLTSLGFVWTYFGKPETMDPGSICVMPELTYEWSTIAAMIKSRKWLGYCTDYPHKVRACRK